MLKCKYNVFYLTLPLQKKFKSCIKYDDKNIINIYFNVLSKKKKPTGINIRL